jgi:hypothetical protein
MPVGEMSGCGSTVSGAPPVPTEFDLDVPATFMADAVNRGRTTPTGDLGSVQPMSQLGKLVHPK